MWGLFDVNVAINQIVKPGYTLSWAAKWHGEDEVYYSDVTEGTGAMLERLHHLLNEADVVVHYNGTKFDIPTINKEFILFGLQPPSPYKQVDLINTVRSQFKFASNKLDFVCMMLGLGGKAKHAGFNLWVQCMAGDRIAFQSLKEYNIQDVHLLEALYNRILPWIRNHPNRAVYAPVDGLVCPKCGGKHFQKRGTAVTTVGVYQRYNCQECGNWFRDNINVGKKARERFNNV